MKLIFSLLMTLFLVATAPPSVVDAIDDNHFNYDQVENHLINDIDNPQPKIEATETFLIDRGEDAYQPIHFYTSSFIDDYQDFSAEFKLYDMANSHAQAIHKTNLGYSYSVNSPPQIRFN